MNLICFKGPNTVGRITSEKSIDVFVRKKPRSDDARLRWRTVLQSICEHMRFELSKVSAGADVSLSQKIDSKNPRNMLLREDWSKKCWMRDCTELQKLVEQRLARNWSHGFSSIILKGKFVFCSQYCSIVSYDESKKKMLSGGKKEHVTLRTSAHISLTRLSWWSHSVCSTGWLWGMFTGEWQRLR